MIDCPAGKYCDVQTSTTASAPDCEVGKYCPLGSLEQLPCAAGSYQDATAQSTCTACEVGNYCAFEYTLVNTGTS
jgi:hypothetical protein